MFRRFALVTLFAGLVLSSALTGCGARQRSGQNIGTSDAFPPRTILLSAPQDPNYVRSAIIEALSARGYATERETPGSIVANTRQRGAFLRLAINYTSTQVDIYHVESSGMQMNRDGTSRTYGSWIRNLETSIRRSFGRLPVAAQPVVNITIQQ